MRSSSSNQASAPTQFSRAVAWLLSALAFREELHAIEAAISGQGIAICSDVLVAPELASGALVQVSKLTLPGYGFYLVHRSGHPKLASISAFSAWARSMHKMSGSRDLMVAPSAQSQSAT